MKKQLLATAIAGLFVVPAVAQVTISGNLDTTLQRTNKLTTVTGTTPGSVTDNRSGAGVATGGRNNGWATSQLVFSATEDLGGGLKASMVLSQEIGGGAASSGTLGHRDRFVDVSGGFGSVRIGRFGPQIGNLIAYDNASHESAGALHQFSTGGAALFSTSATAVSAGGDFARQDGMIQFTSPSFNGFTVSAAYADSSNKTQAANSTAEVKQQSFGAVYSAGPLKIEFASGERKSKTAAVAGTAAKAFFFNSTANATSTQTTATTLAVGTIVAPLGNNFETADTGSGTLPVGVSSTGVVTVAGVLALNATDVKADMDLFAASYNLGPATLLAAHARRKTTGNPTTSATSGTLTDADVNSIGVLVPLGAVTLQASGYSGKDSRSAAITDDVKLSGHQVSARYSLSKRTFLYAVVGESDIKRDTATSTAFERKEKSTALGLVHSF